MAKRKEKKEHAPIEAKKETANVNLPDYSKCPYCKDSKEIQAPAYPGFEGCKTFPIPCPYCQ